MGATNVEKEATLKRRIRSRNRVKELALASTIHQCENSRAGEAPRSPRPGADFRRSEKSGHVFAASRNLYYRKIIRSAHPPQAADSKSTCYSLRHTVTLVVNVPLPWPVRLPSPSCLARTPPLSSSPNFFFPVTTFGMNTFKESAFLTPLE